MIKIPKKTHNIVAALVFRTSAAAIGACIVLGWKLLIPVFILMIAGAFILETDED